MNQDLSTVVHEALMPYADRAWIVGFSGGVDSTVLLHLAQRAAAVLHPPALHAVHLNHCLRAEESEEDATFCEALCQEWGITFTGAREDVAARAKWNGTGIEEAGRAARLALFQQVSAQYDQPLILLAHHEDDQAETTLMRLLRGTGLRGLAAMRTLTGLRVRGVTLEVLRPLLTLPKAELLAYARAEALAWRLDASNTSNAYLRNRIRHEALPALQKIAPDASKRIRETAARLREVDDWLEDVAEKLCNQALQQRAEGHLLVLPAESPLPVLRRVIERVGAQVLGVPGYVWNAHEAVVNTLRHATAGTHLELPGGLRLFRDRDGWIVSTMDTPRPAPPTVLLMQGALPIRAYDAGLSVLIEAVPSMPAHIPAADREDQQVEWFDADAVHFPLILRPRANGDRMQPLGAPGSRKIKEILIDIKASQLQKDRTRLLLDAEGPLWLWPIRRSERGRISP